MPRKQYPDFNKSFRENAKNLIPPMFDNFMSHRPEVLRHPRSVHQLHNMRINGKSLRYTLEIFRLGFGKEFNACYSQVKNLIDVMGKIHDCDVAIPILREYIDEVRRGNRNGSSATEKLSVKAVIDLRALTQKKRNRLFGELQSILMQWQKDNFKRRLHVAMK